MPKRSGDDNASPFSWFEISDPPVHILGFGDLLFGFKVKKLTLTDGVDGDHFSVYKPRHAHAGSCNWFILLVQANVVSLIIKYINIIYSRDL